jgi:Fe-Mn family superoxide dismutase
MTGMVLLAGCQPPTKPAATEPARTSKTYAAKDFGKLAGMEGFSALALENHFKLYQGYVKNVNVLLDELTALLKADQAGTPQYAELKRRLGFEANGMLLHEYYFGNLGGKSPLDPKTPLYRAMVENFGSFDLWKKDFLATGGMRGVGWVVTYLDCQSGRLLNFWINEHEVNHPAGWKPVLVMDVWEHAYFTDYQTERAKYLEAFFKNIDWEAVNRRYEARNMQPTEKPPASGEPSAKPKPTAKHAP